MYSYAQQYAYPTYLSKQFLMDFEIYIHCFLLEFHIVINSFLIRHLFPRNTFIYIKLRVYVCKILHHMHIFPHLLFHMIYYTVRCCHIIIEQQQKQCN